ncbi:putative hydrolase YxeP [Thalassocella blandensis]|nr:putative hydrolase YxeP [Thalassocella blandensis]
MSIQWNTIIENAINFRHQLHQHPELTWHEEKTAANVRKNLDELGIEWRECAQHGTVGTIAKNATGKHIALRGDIDALPIQEQTALDYCSKEQGKMHACGHDGHTAALWAAAAWLKQHEAQLPGPVSFIFQPAEEGGHGAREMINAGALDGVDEIYGWHNWPAIALGKAVCPDGPVMSGNGVFTITVKGEGGHASQPELCRDPVLAAAAIILNLQQIISRRLAPQDAAVVSVTSMDAVSGLTVIPHEAKIAGSVRLSKPELRQTINQLIEDISLHTANTYGVSAVVDIEDRYEATINHAQAATRYRAALQTQFGEAWLSEDTTTPIMASEDFSYYLQKVPGAFALIGMSDGEKFHYPCHSPHYEFNDQLLEPVVRVFVALAGGPKP